MIEDIEKGYPGQYFEDFLKEQGTYESTTAQAVKRVLAFQLAEAMKAQGLSKVEMARRLCTRAAPSLIDCSTLKTRESPSAYSPAPPKRLAGNCGSSWHERSPVMR